MKSELRTALAEDLEQLIRLHDRELDQELLAALKAEKFPDGLALLPADEVAQQAYANMANALLEDISLDQLAADFAAIYLNNVFGASPYESVWVSDEHLACDHSMFELREIYAAVGLKATDWHKRFDDHFVLQFQYLRHVLMLETTDFKAVAHFIDEHVGYWFPDFARQASMRCNTAFYASLAELTHIWLMRFRELLDEMFDLPIPSREQMTAKIQRKQALEKAEILPIHFSPGAQGPSW